MIGNALESLRKLPLNGGTEETPGATQADIDIFVYEILVNFLHAVEADIEDRFKFQAFDELDRENADAGRISESLSPMRRFKLKAVFQQDGFQFLFERFNVILMGHQNCGRGQVLAAQGVDFAYPIG